MHAGPGDFVPSVWLVDQQSVSTLINKTVSTFCSSPSAKILILLASLRFFTSFEASRWIIHSTDTDWSKVWNESSWVASPIITCHLRSLSLTWWSVECRVRRIPTIAVFYIYEYTPESIHIEEIVVNMTITNTFPEYLRKCFAGESLAPELSRLRFSKALTVHEVLVGVRDGAIGRKEGSIVLGRSCCVISINVVGNIK